MINFIFNFSWSMVELILFPFIMLFFVRLFVKLLK